MKTFTVRVNQTFQLSTTKTLLKNYGFMSEKLCHNKTVTISTIKVFDKINNEKNMLI